MRRTPIHHKPQRPHYRFCPSVCPSVYTPHYAGRNRRIISLVRLCLSFSDAGLALVQSTVGLPCYVHLYTQTTQTALRILPVRLFACSSVSFRFWSMRHRAATTYRAYTPQTIGRLHYKPCPSVRPSVCLSVILLPLLLQLTGLLYLLLLLLTDVCLLYSRRSRSLCCCCRRQRHGTTTTTTTTTSTTTTTTTLLVPTSRNYNNNNYYYYFH